ncbi:hypothetical protein F5Y16DRAFT_389355 [Xylariaceae sp. FL0255]|nr:hypothetical protein F5Y16DRAFT_389355 [Xylariaceae sp. FL0255]
MDNSQARRTAVYNGISDRARGWKTKKTEKSIGPSSSAHPDTKRWDGASRSSDAWDCLKRDPELWFKEGDCYVHLYAEGQSRRGPAFKIRFATLLEANCHPLIERFISPTFSAQYDVDNEYSDGKIAGHYELYIPAPLHSDKNQSFHYHLATRNFLAFIFGRSMVGESLGGSLITLLNSMHEFRSPDVDNVEDLMSYMDEEGYLDMTDQSAHALAMLRLAETFQLRTLYINAFAHCCGMNNRLFLDHEYQLLSSRTRTLIRRSRAEMDGKLAQCGLMLRTFLQDALSEVNLNLLSGAWAHIERFRTLLHGLYAARFGYYPPRSTNAESAATFEMEVLRVMRDDFEALYNYLVDESFNITQGKPFFTQDGICTLHNVAAFDGRFEYDTLFHPLPLLPEIPTEPPRPRRLSWVRKPLEQDKAQVSRTLAALLQATNSRRPGVLKNPLVRAYRKFEEDSVCSPIKADKLENLGPADSRKVRWILIYAIYQTLRQATIAPAEVLDVDAPYHLCISMANLPPWNEQRPVHMLVRNLTDQLAQSPSTPSLTWSSRSSSPSPTTLELQPDIDYRALTYQSSQNKVRNAKKANRASSLRASLTASASIKSLPVRRAFSLFATKPEPERSPSTSRTPTHQQIVVDGYGNGMNNVPKVERVALPANQTKPVLPSCDKILSSPGSTGSTGSYSNSDSGSSDSSNTSEGDSPIEDHGMEEWGFPEAQHQQSKVSDKDAPASSHRRRPSSIQGLPESALEIAPLNINKTRANSLQMPSPQKAAPVALDYIKAVVEAETIFMEDGAEDEWGQFRDLGGLVELGSAGSALNLRKARRASMPAMSA